MKHKKFCRMYIQKKQELLYYSTDKIICRNIKKVEVKMEETIDLREYFAIIKKRFWIIALLAIISELISGVISFFYVKSSI